MRTNHSVEVKPSFGHREVVVTLSIDAARTVAGVVGAEFPVLAAQLVAAATRLEEHTITTAQRRLNRDQQTNDKGVSDA